MKKANRVLSVTLMAFAVAGSVSFAANKMDVHVSSGFQGPKANTETVWHTYENGESILRVSQDFKAPDTPAPTRSRSRAGKSVKRLCRPTVKDIAKVQATAPRLGGSASG